VQTGCKAHTKTTKWYNVGYHSADRILLATRNNNYDIIVIYWQSP